MENKDLVPASTIVQKVFNKLLGIYLVPKFKEDISVDEMNETIAQREKLRETMRLRWLVR